MEDLEPHVEQLCRVAEVLLGLAHADGLFMDEEAAQVEAILDEFAGGSLPPAVEARIAAFDPATFDLEATCYGLTHDADDRHALLALLMRVADADAVRDFSEDRYLGRVIIAIGATPEDLDGLV